VDSVHPDLTALLNRRRAELGGDSRPLSFRELARRAERLGFSEGVRQTFAEIGKGIHSGRLEDKTVDALARVLEVSRAEVLRAMHETRPERVAWEPPDEAELLNLRQRRVLEELIRVMVEVDRVQAGAVGDSSRRASLTALSPAVSTAQMSLTPAVKARVARLGELVEHTPQLMDEFLAQSDELLRRYEDRGTESSETG
jgi:hypothetical protein